MHTSTSILVEAGQSVLRSFCKLPTGGMSEQVQKSFNFKWEFRILNIAWNYESYLCEVAFITRSHWRTFYWPRTTRNVNVPVYSFTQMAGNSSLYKMVLNACVGRRQGWGLKLLSDCTLQFYVFMCLLPCKWAFLYELEPYFWIWIANY